MTGNTGPVTAAVSGMGLHHDWYTRWDANQINARLPGTLHQLWVTSSHLTGNPLGDPAERPCLIYHPDTTTPIAELPHLYLLHGAFVTAVSWLTSGALAHIDEWMTRTGHELVIVMPDAWTSVGGSQYRDSPAIGNYLSYLAHDVLTDVDTTIPVAGSAARTRYLMGHSSGGLGAYNLATTHPGLFRSIAMIAPDALFEGVHLSTAIPAHRALHSGFGGSWDTFAHAIAHIPTADLDPALIDQWMLAHAYAPTTTPTPLITTNGALDTDVWASWTQLDPVRRAPTDRDALAALDRLYLSGGTADPTFSDVGSRALHATLRTLGIDAHHDELATDHRAIGYLTPALDHLFSPAGPRAH